MEQNIYGYLFPPHGYLFQPGQNLRLSLIFQIECGKMRVTALPLALT